MPDTAPTIDTSRLERLTRRLGGANEAMSQLLKENAEYRERHRQDAARIAELEKQAVPDGAKVLTGDEAKAYDAAVLAAYRKLGTPEELQTRLTEHAQLATYRTETERGKVVDEAARALGWKPAVLRDLITSKGLALEFRDVQVQDQGETKAVRTAHVRAASDEQATPVPLATYAKDHLADYLPALVADEGGGSSADASGGPTRTPFPAQSGTAPATRGQGKTPEELAAAKRASGIYGF